MNDGECHSPWALSMGGRCTSHRPCRGSAQRCVCPKMSPQAAAHRRGSSASGSASHRTTTGAAPAARCSTTRIRTMRNSAAPATAGGQKLRRQILRVLRASACASVARPGSGSGGACSIQPTQVQGYEEKGVAMSTAIRRLDGRVIADLKRFQARMLGLGSTMVIARQREASSSRRR